jgi:ligand-binding SRPBCC domain-containing protein
MKVYQLVRTQFLPLTLENAWNFFSSPANLSIITPPALGLRMLDASQTQRMYAGQIIRYRIRILPGINVSWVTEITHVREPYFFVDEQRSGPYAFWHHQHRFKEVPGGVEMSDEIHYAVPFGLLGNVVHRLFVGGKLKTIFDYRRVVLEKRFCK